MIGLDRLMEKPGVVAAGQFSKEGKFERTVGEFGEEMKTEAAKFCASVNETASKHPTRWPRRPA